MLRAARVMMRVSLRTRQSEAMAGSDEPSIHHQRGELGMKLDAIGTLAITHGLHGKIIALRKLHSTRG